MREARDQDHRGQHRRQKGAWSAANGIQQDRLIKKMRLLGISDDASANAYVQSIYLPELNARFAVEPARSVDYHVPRDPALADRDVSAWSTFAPSATTSWCSSAAVAYS